MDNDTYAEILAAIKYRSTWDVRQDKWYKMRFMGIRRTVKPYTNAPDQHYPLADTVIEKLKPFYVQQIYANERLATFVSQKGASREITTMAEQDFDYNIKQRSNFENAIMIGVDMHLQAGLCPFKIYWDTDKNQLAFDPIDPVYVIVPQWTEDIQHADWLTHVIRMSKTQYLANDHYDHTLVDRITGRGTAESGSGVMKEQDTAQREGLTYAPTDSEVIVWECYTQDNGKWLIETIAPALGPDTDLREPFHLPYRHGKLPFVALRADTSQKGYYSPRGVPEILFKHELALNKSWNAKLQYLDFFGSPVFSNTSLSPINTTNFRNEPGKILPQGITPLPPTNAPLDFEQEMQFTRALAEDRIRIPDLGSNESLTGPASNTKGGKTATAVTAIVGLSNQSNDLRARVFRLQLGEIYNQAWQLRVQYAGDQLQYIYNQSISELPLDALNDVYTITPSGSADSWNVSARSQKALATYQLLFGKPNVNQDELLKYVLENSDEPILVKRLFQDAGQSQQSQGERQASEIGNMLLGYPVQVKPDDDDQTHLKTLFGFTQRRMATGEPLPPEFMQLGMQHAAQHVGALKAKKDKSAPMWNRILQQAQKMMAQQAPPTSPGVMQQAGAQAGGPPGAPPGLPSPAPAAPAPGGGNGQPNSAQIAQALAALMKSGAHVSVDDVNAALVGMHLPPLAQSVAPPAQAVNTVKAVHSIMAPKLNPPVPKPVPVPVK